MQSLKAEPAETVLTDFYRLYNSGGMKAKRDAVVVGETALETIRRSAESLPNSREATDRVLIAYGRLYGVEVFTFDFIHPQEVAVIPHEKALFLRNLAEVWSKESMATLWKTLWKMDDRSGGDDD